MHENNFARSIAIFVPNWNTQMSCHTNESPDHQTTPHMQGSVFSTSRFIHSVNYMGFTAS